MAFGGRAEAQQEDEPTFQMAPMIDVVFMLLIFFLVATSFQKFESKLNADIPQQLEQQTDEPPKQVIVKVLPNGMVKANDRTETKQQFFSELRVLVSLDANQYVFIDGEDNARHKDVIEVFDECNRIGATVTVIPPYKK